LILYDAELSELCVNCHKLNASLKYDYSNMSFATAFITGVAALLLEMHHHLSYAELNDMLLQLCGRKDLTR